ncbi:MAG: alkaline phosphatase PhoX [Nitrospirota bacterium]
MRLKQRSGLVLSLGMLGLAALLPLQRVQADDGFEGLQDFGQQVQRSLEQRSFLLFGVHKPLKESAPPTTGDYRMPDQKAQDQIVLAKSLKAEYVTRQAAHNADQFAFWPSDEQPTHLLFCIEEFTPHKIGEYPSGVPKLTPGVQRIRLSDGAVDTILRGTAGCDGIRRTPWGTILATEEVDDGAAYEIMDPLDVTNLTVINRATGAVIDVNGVPSAKVVKRTALPTLAWEGIGILPNGVVYLGDEERPGSAAPDSDGGAIYKFIPANPRTESGPISALAQSPLAAGNVYAMQVSCRTGRQQYGQGCEVGHVAWIPVSAADARSDAHKAGATGYYRPEDMELDPQYEGEGVRFCWAATGSAGSGQYAEVACAVDRAPLTADPRQQTVLVERFIEGDQDFNQFDNLEFQPKTGNLYVIEDNDNGDIFACLPDGDDRDIKSDGCVKILSVKDSSAEPTGFKFALDGTTAYLSIQHSSDGKMPKVDDYPTDDILKITGFQIPPHFRR